MERVKNMTGSLQICISCFQPHESQVLAACRANKDAARQLLVELESRRLPATWIVSARETSSFTELLSGATQRNQIALGIAADDLGSAHSELHEPKERAHAHLIELMECATRQGIPISAVAPLDENASHFLDRHVDLLAATGVYLLRRPGRTEQRRMIAPRPRFGVWSMMPTASFPMSKGLVARWDPSFEAKKSLYRAASYGTAEHLTVDLSRIAASPSLLSRFGKLAAHATRLQAAGKIRCETLSDTVARLYPTSRATKARSILKAA